MKKKSFKATFAVAAIAAVGFSLYKAYNSYTAANLSEDDLFLAENVLALAENVPNGTVLVINGHKTCHKLVTDKSKKQEYEYQDSDGKWVKGYYYWNYDDSRTAYSCDLISVKEYRNQDYCWASTLKKCSEYGGTEEQLDDYMLGWR